VYLLGGGCFRTAGVRGDVRRVLGPPDDQLSQLRSDPGKWRGKGRVRRVPRSQRRGRSAEGSRLAVWYQKLYHRRYGPLLARPLEPVATANRAPRARQAKRDRRPEAVDKALGQLSDGVGIAA
jgi:hypothetical protein